MKLKILEQKESRLKVLIEDQDGEPFGNVVIDCWTISRMATPPEEREEELRVSFDCFPTDRTESDFKMSKFTPLKGK